MDRRAFLKGSLLAVSAVGMTALASQAFDDVFDVDLVVEDPGRHGMSMLNRDAETSLRIWGHNIHSTRYITYSNGDIHHG